MMSHTDPEKKNVSFIAKQAILLGLTLLFIVFLTVPTIQFVSAILNPEKLKEEKETVLNKKNAVQDDLKRVKAEMLMGEADTEKMRDLKEKEKDLKIQLAASLERLDQVQSRLEEIQAKVQTLDLNPKQDGITKTLSRIAITSNILGVLCPLVSFAWFISSWRGRRRELLQNRSNIPEKRQVSGDVEYSGAGSKSSNQD